MPLFFEYGQGTSINIDSDIPKPSLTNGTAARKFFATDLSNEQQPLDVESRSNDDHMIEQAASLKGTAVAAESIAEQARINLLAARGQLAGVPTLVSPDIKGTLPARSEADFASDLGVRSLILADSIRESLPTLNVVELANDFHRRVPDFVFQRRVDVPHPPAFNPAVPTLDSITVDMDKHKGTVDCFFAHLRFSLPVSQVWDGKVKAVRIFRSSILSPLFQRGVAPVITLRGMERLSTLKLRSRMKVQDPLGPMGHRYREAGVLTALDILNPIDPQTNLRQGTSLSDSYSDLNGNSAAAATVIPNVRADVSSFLNPEKFESLDRAVASDPLVLRNIQKQDPSSAHVDVPQNITLNTAVARRQGLLNHDQVPHLRNNITSPIVVDDNNRQEFREIAFLSLDKTKSTIVGDHVNYEFVDESVGFGKGYKYYITTVDREMIESVRSAIVDVTIEGIRIPERPKRVFGFNVSDGVALNVIVDEQLVEKFEVFRKEHNIALAKISSMISNVMSDVRGFNVSSSRVLRGENGFIKIGECLNGSKGGGATFYDRDVSPGLKYIYRIYSVDVFGNKSESPYELEVFVPEKKSKVNDLIKPSLTAEVDGGTHKMKLVFKCTDPRVKNLFLARRDLTIGQAAFSAPGDVNHVKFGIPDAGQGPIRFEDVKLRGENKDVSWTGMFENSTQEITFIDKTASVDHTYQYRIYGVDLFGNETPFEFSRKVMVTNIPIINPPINMTAEVVQGVNFTVAGVSLTWQEGNIDRSTEDLLGSRDKLSDNSVRTLYQLERRKAGEERWYEFPMIEHTSFFDPSADGAVRRSNASLRGTHVSELLSARFRPPHIEANQTYVYRVKAMQSGTFVSNYGTYVEVFASLPISPPANFRVKSSDAKVKPFYTVLNWDTSNDSATVDRWEIERAEMNNFAAGRLNLKNPYDFQTLQFRPFRVVYRESSRFRSQGLDVSLRTRASVASLANQTNFLVQPVSNFTGQHQFQDTDVRFGNTYFYRIRAVGVNGVTSSWVYKGMKLTEAGVERVIQNVITPELKQILTASPIPLVLTPFKLPPALSSFSMQPSFSNPAIAEVPTVKAPPPMTLAVKQPEPVPTFSSATSRTSVLTTSVARSQLLKPTSSLFLGGF